MSSSWNEFRRTGTTRTAEQLRKLGLLIVDDEEAIVESLADVFRESFDTYRCSTAREALEVFKQHQPRIVLSDQRMPDMTGIEFLRQVKEINPDTIGILVTAYSDIHVVVTALNEGLVWKYVTKPWDHEQLRKLVIEAGREFLRRSGSDEKSYSFMGH